jgi:hypothetical protein
MQYSVLIIPFAKMEFRPHSTELLKTPQEAILGFSSVTCEPPYIKIASLIGGRNVSDNNNCRNHFRRAPFSFGRAKENEQLSSCTMISENFDHQIMNHTRGVSVE